MTSRPAPAWKRTRAPRMPRPPFWNKIVMRCGYNIGSSYGLMKAMKRAGIDVASVSEKELHEFLERHRAESKRGAAERIIALSKARSLKCAEADVRPIAIIERWSAIVAASGYAAGSGHHLLAVAKEQGFDLSSASEEDIVAFFRNHKERGRNKLSKAKEARKRIAAISGYSESSSAYLLTVAIGAGFDVLSASDEEINEFFVKRRERVEEEERERRARRREETGNIKHAAQAVAGVTPAAVYISARRRGISPMEEIERRKRVESGAENPDTEPKLLSPQGRPPTRGVPLDMIAASLGMSRQGLWKAARLNGRSIDEEIDRRMKAIEGSKTEGEKRVSLRTIHEMAASDARDSVIDTILAIGERPSGVEIGGAARRISMLASRTRMSPQLFLSFVKTEAVTSSGDSMIVVIESVPLMSHLKPSDKSGLIASLATVYRSKIDRRLADTIYASLGTIGHPSAAKAMNVVQALFDANGIKPSPSAISDAKAVLSVFQ